MLHEQVLSVGETGECKYTEEDVKLIELLGEDKAGYSVRKGAKLHTYQHHNGSRRVDQLERGWSLSPEKNGSSTRQRRPCRSLRARR